MKKYYCNFRFDNNDHLQTMQRFVNFALKRPWPSMRVCEKSLELVSNTLIPMALFHCCVDISSQYFFGCHYSYNWMCFAAHR